MAQRGDPGLRTHDPPGEALIASADLSGTNTRRVKRALGALFKGAVGKDVVSLAWAGRTRTAAKRELSMVLLPSRQVTRRQASRGKVSANCLQRLVGAQHPGEWQRLGGHARSRFFREQLLARRPQAGGGLDAHNIAKTELGDARAKHGIIAIPGFGEHDWRADAGGFCSTQLLKRDLRLGLKHHLVGHPGLCASLGIIGPFLRQ